MKFNFVTLFPDMITDYMKHGMISKFIDKSNIEINIVDLRKFGKGNSREVDDYVFGTGKSMLIRIDVLKKCFDSFEKGHTVLTTPRGNQFNQKLARKMSKLENITFLCGRYEGFDGRILEYVDSSLCIGDFVLNGGELAALSMFESIIRLKTDFTDKHNIDNDSFENGALEGESYTRPAEFQGKKVPDILLTGNHEKINDFNRKSSLIETLRWRKDLFKDLALNFKDIIMLMEYFNEKC